MTAIRTSAILDTWTVRDRSQRASKLYDASEKRFREAVSMIDKMEDLVDFCLNNIPQIAPLMEHQEIYERLGWQGRDMYLAPRVNIRETPPSDSMELVFHGLPYEQMVIHFAGPIHRMYNCAWKFSVGDKRITLSADVQVRDYGSPILLDLDCYLDNMERCIIIEDKESYTHTTANYRIKCS